MCKISLVCVNRFRNPCPVVYEINLPLQNDFQNPLSSHHRHVSWVSDIFNLRGLKDPSRASETVALWALAVYSEQKLLLLLLAKGIPLQDIIDIPVWLLLDIMQYKFQVWNIQGLTYISIVSFSFSHFIPTSQFSFYCDYDKNGALTCNGNYLRNRKSNN